jgi:FKBP-type peptidyl-prolyl cis-trans isomerase
MKKILPIAAIVILLAAGGWYMMSQKKNAPTQTPPATQTQETTKQQPIAPAADAPGKSLKVDYVGSFPDGQVFDTNIADVAKKNNIFAEGREYAPLPFTVGTHAVIPGFEKAAAGLEKA